MSKEEIQTAYCENMANDKTVMEKCGGNSACIRKEVMKCMKMERYTCDPNFDKGRSVNEHLREKGFVIQTIIATQHTDYTTHDSIVKADYIRAETEDGYPFIIYLDSKGHVETEGCVTEMTCLQDRCFVTESQLKAMYKLCIPAVRGVAIFTTNGITTAMYNPKMEMISYNHSYMHIEEENDLILEVAVPYPIIPLSEVLCKPEAVSQRVKFVLEPLRNLIIERAVKNSKEVMCEVEEFPKKLCRFNDTFFTRLDELKDSIDELRNILVDNEKYKCPCSKEKKACDCERVKYLEITRYNLAVRERYFNEMISLYSALSMKLKVLCSLGKDIDFTNDILDDRYCSFSNMIIDPSASWSEEIN